MDVLYLIVSFDTYLLCFLSPLLPCSASTEQFGCLVWSHSQTHLLYVAERKRAKAEPYFQVENKNCIKKVQHILWL